MKKNSIFAIVIIGLVIGTALVGCVEKKEIKEEKKPEEIIIKPGEVEYLPSVNSKFTFHVKSSGDKAATVSLWEELGERDENHQYMGVREQVKGKTKEGVIEDSEPRICAWWRTTVPSNPNFYADFNYALEDNVLYYNREEQSTGEVKYYINCLKALSFPITTGDGWTDETIFYTYLPDTGVFLARTYESKDLTSDSITAKVTVDKKESVVTPAGAFECYKVTTVFTSKTGKGLTKATSTITMERWWSPELNYFVKECDSIYTDALMDYSGTIDKELINYELAS
jgi:hypothetical protein